MKKQWVVILATVFFSGIAFADCSDNVIVDTDSFTKKTSIKTETCTTNPNPDRKYETASHLLTSSGNDIYTLILLVSYDDRTSRRYKTVVDDKGNYYKNLSNEKIQRCMSHLCSFFASTMVLLDRKQMEQAAREGLNVRFDASEATSEKNRIFNISSSQAKAFLDSYDLNFKKAE